MITPSAPAIFLVGVSRSGLSLLADWIQGPHVHCVREKQIRNRFAEFGRQHLFDLAYRGDISEDLFRHYFLGSRLPRIERLAPRHVYCEQLPLASLGLEAVLRVLPEARFIEVHRDGRDVVQSMWNAGWYAPQEKLRRWVPRGSLEEWSELTPFEKCCTHLTQCAPFTVFNQLTRTAPDYLSVSYEELVSSPEESLDRLEAFVGTELFRPTRTVRPSVGNWEHWNEERRSTYLEILGSEGLRAQRLLGYTVSHHADRWSAKEPVVSRASAAIA